MCKQQLLKVKKIPPSNVETRREQYGSFQICLQSLHKASVWLPGLACSPATPQHANRLTATIMMQLSRNPNPTKGSALCSNTVEERQTSAPRKIKGTLTFFERMCNQAKHNSSSLTCLHNLPTIA